MSKPRIVIFARRLDADGNADLVFEITTEHGRNRRIGELSKQGYEVYSGPAASDEEPEAKPTVCPQCNGARRVVVGPPLGSADGPQYDTCPTCHGTGLGPKE